MCVCVSDCGRLFGFFAWYCFFFLTWDNQHRLTSDRARRIIAPHERDSTLFIFLCISLALAIFPTHRIKENANDVSSKYKYRQIQHHDAAIWSRIAVKWSLLFRCSHVCIHRCAIVCAAVCIVCVLAPSLCLPVEPVLLIIHITVSEYLLNKLFRINWKESKQHK